MYHLAMVMIIGVLTCLSTTFQLSQHNYWFSLVKANIGFLGTSRTSSIWKVGKEGGKNSLLFDDQ